MDSRLSTGLAVAGVAVAIGLMIYMAFGGGRASTDGYQAVQAQCRSCGGQFSLSAEAVAAERAAAGDPRKDLNCPLCGKKNAAVTMTRCDKCGKYYLPADAAQVGHRKCPTCGFDPDAR